MRFAVVSIGLANSGSAHGPALTVGGARGDACAAAEPAQKSHELPFSLILPHRIAMSALNPKPSASPPPR